MMAKRSRSPSSSPFGDEAASNTTRFSSEPDDLRTAKLAAYDSPEVNQDKYIMHCSLPPHSKSLDFSTLEEFEVHYAKEHTNRCVECGKNLPSAHFLALHLDESHNPLREALAAKGEKTFSCFLPDCEKKCSSPQKRRLHLIDKHGFPKIYNFRVINNGIDNANTLLQEGRRRRVSLVNGESFLARQPPTSMMKSPERDLNLDQEAKSEVETKAPSTKQTSSAVTTSGSDEIRAGPALSKKSTKSVPSSTSDDIAGLERSLAALQFVPRSVLSKGGKKTA